MTRSDDSNNNRADVRRVLVIFTHPALQKSQVNRILFLGVEAMKGVTFHDLYEA
jgi:glutathione-regulated potassium-efflux system ancillary protein KefG